MDCDLSYVFKLKSPHIYLLIAAQVAQSLDTRINIRTVQKKTLVIETLSLGKG